MRCKCIHSLTEPQSQGWKPGILWLDDSTRSSDCGELGKKTRFLKIGDFRIRPDNPVMSCREIKIDVTVCKYICAIIMGLGTFWVENIGPPWPCTEPSVAATLGDWVRAPKYICSGAITCKVTRLPNLPVAFMQKRPTRTGLFCKSTETM